MSCYWAPQIKVAQVTDRERIKEFHIPIHLKTSTNNEAELQLQIADLPTDFPSLFDDAPFSRARFRFVENEDREILGNVGLAPVSENPNSGERMGEIECFSVKETVRGQGLGKALLARILEDAKELQYSKVKVVTMPDRMSTAYDMYLRAGFKEIEQKAENNFIFSFLERDL